MFFLCLQVRIAARTQPVSAIGNAEIDESKRFLLRVAGEAVGNQGAELVAVRDRAALEGRPIRPVVDPGLAACWCKACLFLLGDGLDELLGLLQGFVNFLFTFSNTWFSCISLSMNDSNSSTNLVSPRFSAERGGRTLAIGISIYPNSDFVKG